MFIILIGLVKALWGVAKNEFGSSQDLQFWKQLQRIRHGLGTYLLLGLEFMIASDILHSVIAPQLESVLELGALVLVRTLIAYFLGKELAAIHGAYLALGGLRHMRRTGKGQRIDLSLQEAITFAAGSTVARYAQRMNDPDSARLAVDTAIQLEGREGVNARLAAAALAVELGDPDLAVLRLRDAYNIDPNDERVRQKLRDLGEVPGPTLTLEPGAIVNP